MSTESTRLPKRQKTRDDTQEKGASSSLAAPTKDTSRNQDRMIEKEGTDIPQQRAQRKRSKTSEAKQGKQEQEEEENRYEKKKTTKKESREVDEDKNKETGDGDADEDETEEDEDDDVGRKSNDRDDEKDEDYDEGDARMDEEAEADIDDDDAADDDDNSDGDDDDDDDEFEGSQRRSKRGSGKKKSKKQTRKTEEDMSTRRSSRTNKFSGSLRDEPVKPPLGTLDEGNSDDKISSEKRGRNGKSRKNSSMRTKRDEDDDEEGSSEMEDEDEEMGTEDEEESNDSSDSKEKKRSTKRSRSRDTGSTNTKHAKKSRSSSTSSRSRDRTTSRSGKKKRSVVAAVSDSDDSLGDEDETEDSALDEDDDEDEYQLQRIIASRTETRGKWREIMEKMNTTEVSKGTRLRTEATGDEAGEASEKDEIFVERFLVKWANFSFLHCSWELEEDLKKYVDDAKTRLTTFFRKSENGYLFDSDERGDGDYFNPAFVQVDRVLEVVHETEEPKKKSTGRKGKRRRDEESTTATATQEAGEPSSDPRPQIITDPEDPNYDSGMGRQLLVKWGESPYVDSTYEYERDLILQNIEYEDQLTEFLRRSVKPNKANMKDRYVVETKGKKQLVQLFADNAGKEARIEAFQKELEEMTFDNGGKLRNYQAEGVSWLLSNHISGRSSILADEMGLGKTIQTACYISLLAQKLSIRGPFLIVAPLSTLVHWKREFSEWTNFNTVVYHGTAEDRDLIRQYEMAFPKDRPEETHRFQHFLKKCHKPKALKWERTWMAEVVITSPEMLVTDDHKELTFVEWEVLVVDEAHRLKNKASKLAKNLTQSNFLFRQVAFLTGTPIQNNMTEMWTLLHLIDATEFPDLEQFLEEYGDIKSKEKLDELHERIRPYILRRLKEDVEKSVPPKEETVIEVELTVLQKQYYRALYERNVQFLHRNKRKALDGPSLSNLAMQLRKCCNHPFLLQGVEEAVREQHLEGGVEIDEAELLVKASGKLVLLDKLLPRLKEGGHRVLIFSQFKIMLDVIEDYLRLRKYRSERIDGSITGRARQQAIDKFQLTPEGEDAPFIMLLSTRAGGQGITLTRADTCLLFDSDYNPQNDLQAQARCHRIGQTKNVKVYRLLSRKTYEMQMFHMSSLKMGLDQAVLNGIENGQSTGSAALTKEEVESLLRHGAYDIFAEERNGTSEKESNAFVSQGIDDILARRTKTIVHEQAKTVGGGTSTFSKATFKAGDNTSSTPDIDINDPEFWSKVVGEKEQNTSSSPAKKRARTVATYDENEFDKRIQELSASPDDSRHDSDSDESEVDFDNEVDLNWEGNYTIQNPLLKKIIQSDKSTFVPCERTRWGGNEDCEWSLEKAEAVMEVLSLHGYGNLPSNGMVERAKAEYARFPPSDEVCRMLWSLPLVAFREEVMAQINRKGSKGSEPDAEDEAADNGEGKGSAAQAATERADTDDLYKKFYGENKAWLDYVTKDALEYAKKNSPRSNMDIRTHLRGLSHIGSDKLPDKTPKIVAAFEQSIWPSLRARGWEEIEKTDKEGNDESSEEEEQKRLPWRKRYRHQGKTFESVYTVLDSALSEHPELATAIESTISSLEAASRQEQKYEASGEVQVTDEREFLQSSLTALTSFLAKYAPLQLIFDRSRTRTLKLTKKFVSILSLMEKAHRLVKLATEKGGKEAGTEDSRLAELIHLSKRCLLPHPSWSSAQDVALIRAIVKHGWIEHPRQRAKIAADSSLYWGAPFDGKSQEAQETQEVASKSTQDLQFAELKAAAERALKRLNGDMDWLKELKGFDVEKIAKILCLSSKGSKSRYELNETALRKLIDDRSRRLNPSGTTDGIPTGKELVKRATLLILSKASQADETRESRDGAQVANDDTAGQTPTQFGLLDQSEPCNILLLEMLRAVLKGNKTMCIRKLLKNGEEEAKARSRDRSKIDGGEKGSNELKKIAEGLHFCDQHIKASPRQSKNVIRAILGKNLTSSKNPAESAFPTVRAPPLTTTTTVSSKSNVKDSGHGPNAGDDSGGSGRDYSYAEDAINTALTAQQQREKGKLPKSGDNTHDLQLTFSEVLILSVISSQGMPVWSEDWQQLLDSEPEDPVDAISLTWHTMGDVVERAAKRWYLIARRRLNDTEKQLSAARNSKSEKQIQRLEVDYKVLNAEVETKREVVLHARELFQHPERLAKTSVMLLEAVRRRMGPLHLSGAVGLKKARQINKTENGLGPRVLQWYTKEISRWLSSLGVSTSEPMTELEEPDSDGREKIVVACALKKSACRIVFGQVSQLVRLRCIYQRNGSDAARAEKLSKAVRNSSNNEDAWVGRPNWWGSDGGDENTDDSDLLMAVLESGYCGLSQALEEHFRDRSEKPSDTARAALQPRVNHLTRELHIVEETAENIRRLERRSLTKKAPGSGEKTSAAGDGVGAIQTGLHSFFSCQGTKSQMDESSSSRRSPVDLTGSADKKSFSDDDVEVVEEKTKFKAVAEDGI